MDHLKAEHGLSIAKACNCVGLSRSSYYRPNVDWRIKDADVIEGLNKALSRCGRWGFWKCYDWLRWKGYDWNHKRVYRVYCLLGLNQPRRTKRRLPARERRPLDVVEQANVMWALDFVHDTLYNGKRFRTLNVIDEGVRECLAIEVDTSLPAERVVRVLDRLKEWRGLPVQIRLDNGPELISNKLARWCEENQVELAFIRPGKPTQNAFVERFNRTFRNEVLNAHLFDSLAQVQEMAWWWMIEYNEERPHDSTGRVPPTEYRKKLEREMSTLELSH